MPSHLPVLAVVAAALVLAAPAAAAPLPGANYGGGTAPERYALKGDFGLVSVVVTPDGLQARVVATLHIDCARTRAVEGFAVTGTFGPDGRLQMRATTRSLSYLYKPPRGGGQADVDLGFDGPAGSGTITLTTTRKVRGRRRACEATLPVEVRAVPADASAPGVAAPGGVYFGTGDARYRRAAVPVALRIAPDASRIRVSLLGLPLRCPRGRKDYLPNVTAPARIAPDGTFRRVERFKLRSRGGAVTRVRVLLEGRFTAQGVTGTTRVTDSTRAPGERRLRCASKRIAFSAVL